MKKLTPLSVLVLIFVLATGCTGEFHGDLNNLTMNSHEIIVNTQDMLTDVTGNKTRAPEKKTSFNGKFTVWSVPPPPGSQIHVTVNGSGTAARMGKAKLAIQETITIPDTGLWEVDASVVITAANGDELHFIYTGSVDVSGSPVMTFTGTCEVNGGTGAFKNAKGTLVYTGSRSWDTGSGTATFSGEISY